MEIHKFKGNLIPGLNPVCEGCSHRLGMNQVNKGTKCGAVTMDFKGEPVKLLERGEDGRVYCKSYAPDLPSRIEKLRSLVSLLFNGEW